MKTDKKKDNVNPTIDPVAIPYKKEIKPDNAWNLKPATGKDIPGQAWDWLKNQNKAALATQWNINNQQVPITQVGTGQAFQSPTTQAEYDNFYDNTNIPDKTTGYPVAPNSISAPVDGMEIDQNTDSKYRSPITGKPDPDRSYGTQYAITKDNVTGMPARETDFATRYTMNDIERIKKEGTFGDEKKYDAFQNRDGTFVIRMPPGVDTAGRSENNNPAGAQAPQRRELIGGNTIEKPVQNYNKSGERITPYTREDRLRQQLESAQNSMNYLSGKHPMTTNAYGQRVPVANTAREDARISELNYLRGQYAAMRGETAQTDRTKATSKNAAMGMTNKAIVDGESDFAKAQADNATTLAKERITNNGKVNVEKIKLLAKKNNLERTGVFATKESTDAFLGLLQTLGYEEGLSGDSLMNNEELWNKAASFIEKKQTNSRLFNRGMNTPPPKK